MSNEQPLASESGARRWYGGLINLYPGAFREHYAAEMIRVFEESWSQVSKRGAIACWRYWLHVLFDLVRTLPGEWLAAMPLPSKVSLIGIAVSASLCAIDHQWLIIANWLFFCAFASVCGVLVYSSRPRILSSLLLAGAWGWAGFWITIFLAKSIHGSHDHEPNMADHLSVMMAMLVALFCQTRYSGCLNARYLDAHYPRCLDAHETGWNAATRSKFTIRSILSAVCLSGIVLAQFKIISGDSANAGSQTVLAGLLCSTSVSIVTVQLAVIWRGQNHARKPDSETRPA